MPGIGVFGLEAAGRADARRSAIHATSSLTACAGSPRKAGHGPQPEAGFWYIEAMNAAAHTALVDQPGALERLAEVLRGAPWVALDTEFLRERTFYPRLCLVQVATPDTLACVDPIALGGLGPLGEVLLDAGTLKVLHSARQDLEALTRLLGSVPGPVFDTQLAAALLGFADQIGYANLVERMLGVSLAKAHTRADWSRRPLPGAWIDYAADDVRYLVQIYPRMLERLDARGRGDWLDEEFAALCAPENFEPDPEEVWRRVSRTDRLNEHQRAVLQALAAWRERTARSQDRPRLWILRDEVMVDVARSLPRTREALAGIRDLPPRTLERHGSRLLALVAEHRERRLAAPPRNGPVLTPAQEAMVDLLVAVVRLRAAELEIQPGLIAARRELERLAAGERNLKLSSGWRQMAVGAALEALMAGSASLRIDGGRVEMQRSP